MKYRVFVRPEAETDLSEACRWYNQHSKGLGASFLLSVDASISAIKRDPDMFPCVYKNVRRAVTKRFPYGVFYIFNEEMISILAIFHAKRNPEKWMKREIKS